MGQKTDKDTQKMTLKFILVSIKNFLSSDFRHIFLFFILKVARLPYLDPPKPIKMEELLEIQNKIYQVRGMRVMLDFDLAELYQVETKVLKQAVRRNYDRFPEDFMFELTEK